MDFQKNPTNCAQNMGLDMTKVNQCVSSDRGTQLQLKAEQDSKDVIGRSGFVPTIVYNKQYSAGDFWASLDDFGAVINDKRKF